MRRSIVRQFAIHEMRGAVCSGFDAIVMRGDDDGCFMSAKRLEDARKIVKHKFDALVAELV